MFAHRFRTSLVSILFLTAIGAIYSTQTSQGVGATRAPQTTKSPTHADTLRGEYGRYRANNDLLFYNLDIRVDPVKKFVSGKNTIRFKMLKDDTRIQLDLYDNLKVDRILFQRSEVRGQRSDSTA